MPSLGWQELVLILIIVIIIFGAGKLPEIGGALGRGIKEFRSATTENAKDESEDVANGHATGEAAHKDVS